MLHLICVVILVTCGSVKLSDSSTVTGERSDYEQDDDAIQGCRLEARGCIPICCPPGLYISGTTCYENSSVPADDLTFPQMYTKDLEVSDKNVLDFRMVYGIPCPSGSYALDSGQPNYDVFYFLDNGTIYEDSSGTGKPNRILEIDDFCFASLPGENGSQTVVAVCFPPANTIPSFYPIAMILSTPFLAATFVVYTVIPDLQNLHGLTLRAYIAMLFIAYMALAVIQFGGENVLENLEGFCVSLALIIMMIFFKIIIIMTIKVIEITDADDPPCIQAMTVTMQDPIKFQNGSLLYRGIIYPPGSYWTNGNETFGCPCDLIGSKKCVRRCCKFGEIFNGTRCVENDPSSTIKGIQFSLDDLDPLLHSVRLEDHFFFLENPICPENDKYLLEPNEYPSDKFVLQEDGMLRKANTMVKPWYYCMVESTFSNVSVIQECFVTDVAVNYSDIPIYPVGMIVSIIFLLATFLVYALIAELRNIHGKTLMCYVGCLLMAYNMLVPIKFDKGHMQQWLCNTLAFIMHFSFLSSFFWLNIMCFDIWWTFGGFRSLHGSVKQRDRKKFFMYSIYAWGCASVLTGVCLIMDLTPNIPEYLIRPEFGVTNCWFNTNVAKAIYFYGPMAVTVVVNIFLFISTALKIVQHKKETAQHLKGLDSRRHDDNKQWFNLYLKLFIVMGINWSMEIISWLCNDKPKYIWYITDLGNSLQGLIIFIIFVWKKKILRLLMKRFGCTDNNFLSRDSTRSANHSSLSASRTCTTSIPLHGKTNPYVNPAGRIRPIMDDSDSTLT
ncbi:probable G-protein coupled receptor Mth-like 3 [Cephus cinctus]|uniref:Probable G-protein coupled receptor Mth-like 3 n=1 Tax=Cephus cinctus TaxID=211228 RepID=A0AAJ7W1D5_CEPCN|nr:probable G-protein coupled receptor Mth-like 3 [Cephus cinctus]